MKEYVFKEGIEYINIPKVLAREIYEELILTRRMREEQLKQIQQVIKEDDIFKDAIKHTDKLAKILKQFI